MNKDMNSQRLLRLVFWETTVKCNLSCAHCRRIDTDTEAYRDLSTEQAKGLIDQLAEVSEMQELNPVLVFSGGEPLCREDIFDLVAQAKTRGIIPALATNGTLIDSETAARIAQSGVARVSISLDGATAEVHDHLRQLMGSFEQALDGIGQLRKHNVPFQINMTLTRHNAHQLEQVYELAKTLGAVAVHIFMLVPVGCGEVLAETDMLSAEQYEQMMVEIAGLDNRCEIQMKVTCGPHYARVMRQQGLHKSHGHAADGKTPGAAHGHGISRGCLAGLGVLFVAHNGDVFPCGYLPVKCGSVLDSSISEIWQTSKNLARMGDSSALEGKCGRCGYREICGGCRGRAFAETRNYMAEEPFCAYIPPEARQ